MGKQNGTNTSCSWFRPEILRRLGPEARDFTLQWAQSAKNIKNTNPFVFETGDIKQSELSQSFLGIARNIEECTKHLTIYVARQHKLLNP